VSAASTTWASQLANGKAQDLPAVERAPHGEPEERGGVGAHDANRRERGTQRGRRGVPRVMRKLVVLAAAVALAVPAAAPAKVQGALRICGVSGCTILDRHTGHEGWELLADMTGGSMTGPARPGPFYELSILPLDDRGRPQPDFPSARFYYAPRAKRVRTNALVDTSDGIWRALVTPAPQVSAAVRKLRPFPAPRLVRVEVDGRIAKDPHSYLRLFRIPEPKRPVTDPAGPYPSNADRGADTAEIVRYWERVDRHWVPVNLWTRRPSPWGDDWTSLWVARRLPLVKRDGEIVRVPRELAERIRRAQSLR
jgi:hypothetical protein